MASWQRRRGKCVTVTYYDKAQGRLVVLPREQTKHLDGKSPEEIDRWVDAWEKDHGLAKDRIGRMVLGKDDKLRRLWDAYQVNQARRKKRRPGTAEAETRDFERYTVRFFVGEHRRKDPSRWHDLVPGFHDWLYEQPIVDSTRRGILWALERFGKYLQYKLIMSYAFTIQTPNAENHRVTPLKVRLTPEQVLSAVKIHTFVRPHKKHASTKRVSKINFRLAVLIGYFAALGPEELWALEKADLVGGFEGASRSKTYQGFKALEKGLGCKLSVAINKTIVDSKVTPEAKNEYRFGYVTIWHPKAALAIAEILDTLPDGRLFPFTRGYLDRAWREIAYPILGVTVHDLRRASCLYLGRTLRIPTTLLQEHMRHAELDTTMLYCREPRVEMQSEKKTVDPCLDDVV